MKKVIIIGDTHGRDIWQKIVQKENADMVVFIGDYFDTHEGIDADEQIENFKEIIKYKELNAGNVTLLLGNHDYHYLRGVDEHYSGYQEWQSIDIREQLEDAIKKGFIQMCYRHERYICTHAGITKTWCNENDIDLTNVEQSINDLFKKSYIPFAFTSGENYSNTGDDINQTPIWVRPNSLFKDAIDNFIQVVGHTMMDDIMLNPVAIFIDTLGTSKEYLVINDGIAKPCKL